MYKVVFCCLALVGLVGTGCTPSGAEQLPTNKVTGKVTMNGAAVAGATVTFSPVAAGKPAAMGMTDTQGVYNLTTYSSGDGAVAGEYKVMVSKSAASAAPSEPQHDPTGQARGGAPQHSGPKNAQGPSSLLPEKYAKATTTPISKTVKEESNTIDIDLQ